MYIHSILYRYNILLDHHLTAKLGDFGFAQEIPRLTEERSVITVAIVVKSLGYSPPEMDTAHVSCKSDVYCYGVVCINIMYILYLTMGCKSDMYCYGVVCINIMYVLYLTMGWG